MSMPQSANCGQPGIRRPRSGYCWGQGISRLRNEAWHKPSTAGQSLLQHALELPKAVPPSGVREHAQHEHILEEDFPSKGPLFPTAAVPPLLEEWVQACEKAKRKNTFISNQGARGTNPKSWHCATQTSHQRSNEDPQARFCEKCRPGKSALIKRAGPR